MQLFFYILFVIHYIRFMKIALNNDRLNILLARMEKLNKRLARNGIEKFDVVGVKQYASLKAYGDAFSAGEFKEGEHLQMVANGGPVVVLTIDGPDVVKHGSDITYLGTISDKGGVRSINSVDPTVPLFNMETRCDHCGHNRHRVVHHVFRVDGEIKMVGSACCLEYFGYDPTNVINAWVAFTDMNWNDDESFGGGKRDWGYDIGKVLMFTANATNKFGGYTSGTTAQEKSIASTKEKVLDLLNFNSAYATPEDRAAYHQIVDLWKLEHTEEDVNEMIERINAFYVNLEPTTDFDFNMLSALFTDLAGQRILTHSIPSKLIGIAIYGIYKVFHVEAPKAERKPSEFIGAIGDKIGIEGNKKGTLKVTIKSIKDIDSAYGWVTLVMMEDTQGNSLKSFTSTEVPAVGTECFIYGTVKSHDVYNEYKSTNLTRMKFITA